MLQHSITELSDAYPWVNIDNEDGLETLRRRIVHRVDWLALVGVPSATGLATMGRSHALARDIELAFEHCTLVVNRVRGAEPPARAAALAKDNRPSCCWRSPTTRR